MPEHLVVSIARTRDPLKENPAWLAAVLRGEAPVRLSRGHPEAPLDLNALGAVVLWTKEPRALVEHEPLRRAIEALVARGVVVALQPTVTGLGGTPVEPGIRPWIEVRDALAEIVARGVLDGRAVTLRYDPVVRLRDPNGRVWSNASADLADSVVAAFAALGVRRVTASLVQIVEYPRVARRLAALGFEPDGPPLADGRTFLLRLSEIAEARGLTYSTCVFPPDLTSLREGCIDGRWLNGLLEAAGSDRRVTCQLHNVRGRQRPDCRCTFSYDLGYSAGIGHCYDARERWCVYCYSASASGDRRA